MSNIDPRDFGKLEAEVEALRAEFRTHKEESKAALAEQSAKIDQLIGLANKGRGAWWAGLTLATLMGSVVTILISWLTLHH